MDEEELADREKKLKRFATLTLIFVIVAVAATVIDQGIKRQILDEAAKARTTLDEIKRVAAEVRNAGDESRSGQQSEAEHAAAVGHGGGGIGGERVSVVGSENSAGTALDQAQRARVPAPGVEQAGVAGGPSGDG